MLETHRLKIQTLAPSDAGSAAEFQVANRQFMEQQTPPRQEAFYTAEYWRTRLAELEQLSKDDKHYSFFIFEKGRPAIIGLVNFSNVVRGAFQACHLGYELSPNAEGKGLMTEALRALIDYMFKEKNFHRLMANYVPTNRKSERVLEKLGFQREGLAKDYLFLGGSWKDHVLTSLINPAWKQSDPTTVFSDKAQNYTSYRPSYPTEILHFLQRDLGIASGSKVADIGSGTGLFTAQLLAAGYEVTAVEPNDEMRRSAEHALGSNPKFHSSNGRAEATGLSGNSIDLITAAQAFHWFDKEEAAREFKRILKPKGWCALIWNIRREGDGGFHDAYDALLNKYVDYPQRRSKSSDPRQHPLPDSLFGIGKYQLQEFGQVTTLTWEALWGLYQSISYAPGPEHPSHAQARRELEGVFSQYSSDGTVNLEYKTYMYYGHLK